MQHIQAEFIYLNDSNLLNFNDKYHNFYCRFGGGSPWPDVTEGWPQLRERACYPATLVAYARRAGGYETWLQVTQLKQQATTAV